MFRKNATDEIDALDKVIETLEADMLAIDGDTEMYATLLTRLERLYKLKEKNAPKRINPDTLIIAGGNLVGIIIIVAWEHSHVITSKALGFAGKLR